MIEKEKRKADMEAGPNLLFSRINKRDATICDEDWFIATGYFNLGVIEELYKGITADDMFDVVTRLICAQYDRMVAKGDIDVILVEDANTGIPCCFDEKVLNHIRDKVRYALQQEEKERRVRNEMRQQMMQTKREAWEHASHVPISYDADGVPDVEEYEGRLADEVEDVLRENMELAKRMEEKDRTIEKLERENEELKTQHEEDEAMMLEGFGALVLEASDGKKKELQVLDTDVNRTLAEAQRKNGMSQKQIREMEGKIKNLLGKLGNTTIPLKSLAEGLKTFSQIHGLERGRDLLLGLNSILIKEHVWTDNADSLECFFIAAAKENRTALVNVENKQGGVTNISETR